jgi:hypothetical protein
MNQDVGNDGRARRLEPAARRVIAGRHLMKISATRMRSHQGGQFLFPLLEGFRLRHGFPRKIGTGEVSSK